MGWFSRRLTELGAVSLLAVGPLTATASEPTPAELSAEDRALLEQLDLLLELELLEAWDPDENLPIRVADEPVSAETKPEESP